MSTSTIDADPRRPSSRAPPADDDRRRCRSRRRSGAPSCGPTSRRCSRGCASDEKDPRKSLHIDDVAAPRARARRGVRRGDGVVDQLQHGVDVDLRAAPDVRVPQAARQGERVGRAPRPAVPRDRQRRRRASCCASARRCATGSRATRSPCTATTSTTRTRRRTTTRCSRRTSASGATRRTSAASARSRS